MSDRAAKFVSAILASVLAGASLAGVANDAARAADDCLAAPKAETPDGSHWYYRIERATQRHCWYLRAEGEKLSQTAPPNSSATAKPADSIAPPPMQRSVADARAELPARTSIQPPNRQDGPFPAMPANPAMTQDKAAGTDALPSVVATRWPDSSAVSAAVSPQPAAEQLAANAQPGPQSVSSQSASPPSNSSQADSSQSVSAAPPTAAAAVPLATADSSQGMPASLPVLLAVMTGALALAGITASLVLKFGGARRTARLRVRRDRIWESTDIDTIRQLDRPGADVVPRRPVPRDLDQVGAADDRVAEFYAQLSKRVRS